MTDPVCIMFLALNALLVLEVSLFLEVAILRLLTSVGD